MNWIELKRNKGIAGHCQDGGREDYVGQVVDNLLHPPYSRCDCPGTHLLILIWSSYVVSYFLCNWISYGISSCLCTVSSQRFCALCYSRRTYVTWHYVWETTRTRFIKSITAKIILSYRCSVFAAVFQLPDLNWEIWRFLLDMHVSGILFLENVVLYAIKKLIIFWFLWTHTFNKLKYATMFEHIGHFYLHHVQKYSTHSLWNYEGFNN